MIRKSRINMDGVVLPNQHLLPMPDGTNCKRNISSNSSSPLLERKKSHSKQGSKRSHSAPPVRDRISLSPQPLLKKNYNVAWDVDVTPFTEQRRSKTVFGNEHKLANIALKDNLAVLEAIIVEAYLKIQRQSSPLKLFATHRDKQVSMWHKLKWYHTDGQIFSLINIVREWVKSSQKSIWCREQGISMTYLRSFWGQCESIHAALSGSNRQVMKQYSLDKFVNLHFSTHKVDDVDEYIMDLLVHVYGNNMCIYRGVKSAGYFCLGKQMVFRVDLIPGVNNLGDVPKYIVPLGLPKSKSINSFIVLNERKVKNMISCKKIEFGTGLEEIELKKITFEGLGLVLQRRTMSTLHNKLAPEKEMYQDHITKGKMSLYFESNPHSRILHIYVPHTMFNRVEILSKQCMEQVKENMKKESISLEYMKLALNIKPGFACESISSEEHSQILYVRSHSGGTNNLQDIMNRLENEQTQVQVIPQYLLNEIDQLLVVCPSKTQANDIIGYLKNTPCHVALDNGCKVEGVMKMTHNQVVSVTQPPVIGTAALSITSDVDIRKTVSDIENVLIECFGDNYKEKVSFFTRQSEPGLMHVIFSFERNSVMEMISKLNSKTLYGKSITITNIDEIDKQLRTIKISCHDFLHDVLHEEITRCVKSVKNTKIVSKMQNEYGYIDMDICTERRNDTKKLQQCLTDALSSTKITPENAFQRDFLLSDNGGIFLNHVMDRSNSRIYYQHDLACWKVFGTRCSKNIAARMINQINDADTKSIFYSYPIQNNTGNFMAVAKSVDPLGKSISEIPGITQITFDSINNQVICQLSASADVTASFEMLDWDPSTQMNCTEKNVTCSSCFAPTSSKIGQSYVLEGCGHLYCLDCIVQQIQFAIKNNQLPVSCADCNEHFCIQDILSIPNVLKSKINISNLLMSSMRQCVFLAPEKYMFCPNYVCSSVVSPMKSNTTFYRNNGLEVAHTTCTKCSTEICIHCKSVAHKGVSCKENLQEIVGWIQVDPANRRRCSSCSMGIEKNGGCSNVRCIYCKKNICWKCNSIFESEDQCYRHLRSEHGGIN